jgi:hypothetical protein
LADNAICAFHYVIKFILHCLWARVRRLITLHSRVQLVVEPANRVVSQRQRVGKLSHVDEQLLLAVKLFLGLLNLNGLLPNFNQLLIVALLAVHLFLGETAEFAHVARAQTVLALVLRDVETVEVFLVLLAVLLMIILLLLGFNRLLIIQVVLDEPLLLLGVGAELVVGRHVTLGVAHLA